MGPAETGLWPFLYLLVIYQFLLALAATPPGLQGAGSWPATKNWPANGAEYYHSGSSIRAGLRECLMHEPRHMAGGLRLKWVEPVRIPVLSQPGHLSFGELAGRHERPVDGFIQ